MASRFTTSLSIVLLVAVSDLSDLSDTTVLLLTGVFLLVSVSALVRDAEVCLFAGWLLLGGTVLWAATWAARRRAG